MILITRAYKLSDVLFEVLLEYMPSNKLNGLIYAYIACYLGIVFGADNLDLKFLIIRDLNAILYE